MVQGKLFKTRLCVLYQKGNCHRQNCSFAHGNAELRQFYNNVKRDYHRGGDLRDKLDKRLSPRRRYSLPRDTRGRQPFHGASPSRSFEKNSERKDRRKLHFDGQSDFSGSLKGSDAAGHKVKRRKSTSNDSTDVLKEQLKKVCSEISMLDQQRSQLQTLVEEKVEEEDILASRIRELELQLSKEKEECKRTISKIKKFVKAHKRHMRIQEELKRSQGRLQKFGDQLGSGASATIGNEEDLSINIVSDGDAPGYHTISPRNEVQRNSPLTEKGPCTKHDLAEELRKANLTNGGEDRTETVTLGKRFQLNTNPAEVKINKEVVMVENGDDGDQFAGNRRKKRRKSVFGCTSSADKHKVSGFGFSAPLTSMAAHPIDELIEVEFEESVEVEENTTTEIDKGAARDGIKRLPFLPPLPPPFSQVSYSKGEDEHVNVEGLEEEEMVDVDIV